MTPFHEIRDPIHGFIGLTKDEAAIVNTRIFQRLRGIRQLAMASLVYPGALHTRFDHSLGVTHVSGLLADKLLDDDGARRLVRMSALLHDVGHGPFSHVSEQILDQFSPAVDVTVREKIHEQVTARIIETNNELTRHIGQETCREVIGMLKGGSVESLDRGIVSGPLDADKQDYLLRDSYFCGVKYGVFDLARLIDSLTTHTDGTETILAADRDGVSAIEQFVLAKYYMTAQVYRHRVRLITDAMIVRALQLGIEQDGLNWLRRLYTYDGSERFIDNFLDWDDARLSTALLHPLSEPGGWATDFFRRLRDRRLFKRVFSKDLRSFSEPIVRLELPKFIDQGSKKLALEREIADCLTMHAQTPIHPEHVIIHRYGLKSVREQSRNDEGSILVFGDAGTQSFEQASTLFRSIDEKQNDQFIEVYAPFPYQGKLHQRRLAQRFHSEITAILEKTLSSPARIPDFSRSPCQPGLHLNYLFS